MRLLAVVVTLLAACGSPQDAEQPGQPELAAGGGGGGSACQYPYAATQCAADRANSTLGCNAKDVQVTKLELVNAPASCIGGTTFTADVKATITFGSSTRYNVGVFISGDGKDPLTPSAGGGSSACNVSVLTSSSFPLLDVPSDSCGDGGGNLSAVQVIPNVTLLCSAYNGTAGNSGGKVFVPWVATWNNSTASGCCDNRFPKPETTSKCNTSTSPGNATYGTVLVVVLPSITKTGPAAVRPGRSITYSIAVANTTGDAISGVVLTDPAVVNLSVTDVTCPAGVTCPAQASARVAALQGAGISLPAMDKDTSLTFTVQATVDPSTPAGSLTNTASVGLSGQSASSSFTSTVTTACAVDGDCSSGQWCDESTTVCTPLLANGTSIPVDPTHTSPTLDGHCRTDAAALVCASGVCDASDNACGLVNGDGTCSSGDQCRSGVCDVDQLCGWAVGDGPCTSDTAAQVCRSGACSASGTCEPAGGCNVDADCTGGKWCAEAIHTCTAQLANGVAIPSDPPHSSPALNGTCTAGAATLVCASGTCDTADNACGLANGDGSCAPSATSTVCRSGVCDPDGKCGWATGDGPCTAETAALVCRSGTCGTGGTCAAPAGCNVDADCTGGKWCAEATHTCTPTLANGTAMPVDSPHTSPTLDGTCTSAAAAVVCASGTCDTSDNRCGLMNGDASCSAAGQCRSGACDPDHSCGYATGDGPCTSDTAGQVCRSGACSANGTCEPAGGCNVDADCAGGTWCAEATHACTPTLANGAAMPIDGPHSSPTLDGHCSTAAGALVCTSGVCDADDACGLLNGDGACDPSSSSPVCRSGVCDADGLCGYATGDGPCTAETAAQMCRSGACSADQTCMPAPGCNVDADCTGDTWCAEASHACTPRLAKGEAMPSDAPHTSPTLNGTCTAAAAALVCASGVCDGTDDACGLRNGDGTCSSADQCRSGACDPDHLCGYATGDGPCTTGTAADVCRSGACSADLTCRPDPGCNVDADCTGGTWCAEATHTCTPTLANGTAMPSDAPHASPTLNGACTTAAAALVCASGVCDTDDVCGLESGHGPCEPSSSSTVCRSGLCDPGGTCADPSVAYSIVVVGGSGQSATILTGFPGPLVAEVRNAGGTPLAGVDVTFGSPGGGASVTGLPSTATTDPSGRVSATVTANQVAGGPYLVTASVAGVATAASFSLTNQVGAAASLEVVGGDAQSAVVGTAYADPLVVAALDAGGNRVAGAPVTFAVPSSGPSVSLSSITLSTDGSGEASVGATANHLAGPLTVTASLDGGTPVPFSLTNQPGAAASLQRVSGNDQTTTVGTSFGSPLVVQALDGWDNPVPGAHVAWAAPGSGASATPGSSEGWTDDSGLTSVTATANATAGTYAVTASLDGGQHGDFTLTNSATAAITIVAESGTPQSAVVNTTFAAPLVVLVQQGEAPLAHALVTFDVPASGATASPSAASVSTDDTGHARVSATAGVRAGGYTVHASTAGAEQAASFELTNLHGDAARIVADDGSTPQTSTVGSAFAVPLVASLLDAFDNPVPGVVVTFTPPASEPTAVIGESPPIVTDAQGKVTVHATAGASAGSYAVLATAPGVEENASFSLTNSALPPLTLTIVAGSPQQAMVATVFAEPLEVLVSDGSGDPVAGVDVTFSPPASGATASPSSLTATTGADGHAQVNATAGTIAGGYTVLASTARGSAPVSFVLTNAPGAPATIAAQALSTPQSARIGTAYARSLGVSVTDAYGNAVPGALVTFAAPSGEPTAQLGAASLSTDAAGVASVSAVASLHAGSFQVTASVSGVAGPAVFGLTNLASDAASLVVRGGSGQSTLATTDFAQSLVITVTDVEGNPVAGASVGLTLPSSGPSASASPADPVTDGSGRVEIRLTANDQPGAFDLSVWVAGGSAPVGMSFTIVAIPTTTTLATALPEPRLGQHPTVTATVTGQRGTPGGQVRFLIDGQPAGSATLSAGVAALTLAPPSPGAHQVSAHYDAQGAYAASASSDQTLKVTTGGISLNGGGGCGSGGNGVGGLAGLLLALVLAGRSRRQAARVLAVLVAAAGLVTSGPARAQSRPPGARIDTLRAAPAGSEWFTLDSLDFRGEGRPAARVLLDWGHDPLVVYDADGSRRSIAVENQVFLDAGGSLVFLDRFRVAINARAAAYQNGQSSVYQGTQIRPQASAGFGDLGVSGDALVLGEHGGPLALAAGIELGFPTGSRRNLLGAGSASAVPHLAVAGEVGRFAYAGQLGYAFHARGHIADINFNDELLLAAAGGIRYLSGRLLIGPELHASVDVGKAGGEARPLALEGDIGAHYRFTPGWNAGVGLGTGLHKSPGVPDLRVLASVGWAVSGP